MDLNAFWQCMDLIMDSEVYAIWITAIATGLIAISAFINFWLVSKIKTKDDIFRQELSDLYKAIVVSNLVSTGKYYGSKEWNETVKTFNSLYNKVKSGETLFDEPKFN